MSDKWQMAHRLHRPLGWEFLVKPRVRSMTPCQLAEEKERRRAPVRNELVSLGYLDIEIRAIEKGGEAAMLDIDLRKRRSA